MIAASPAPALDDMRQGCQYFDAAQAVAASVMQIDLAVREVRPAVEQLGLLVDNMSTALTTMRDTLTSDHDTGDGAASRVVVAAMVGLLEQSVHGGIVHLQFYDRLAQHLSHVQTFLSEIAAHLANDTESGAEAFEQLRAKLRVRLISEAQRELLDAVLPPPGGAPLNQRQARDEYAAQGTIELF